MGPILTPRPDFETLGVYRDDPVLVQHQLFDFRFRCFHIPVSEKQPTSGLRSKPEIEKLTLHQFRVNYAPPYQNRSMGLGGVSVGPL